MAALTADTAAATAALGECLGARLRGLGEGELTVIGLEGDLGAGKTTFTQGVFRGLGHQGRVKSPTYTLVEPYEVGDRLVHHVDLYRLAGAEELDYLGFDELTAQPGILLIEWPERAPHLASLIDLRVRFEFAEPGRRIALEVRSPRGRALTEPAFAGVPGVNETL